MTRAAAYVPTWASLGELHRDHRVWIICQCGRGRLFSPAEIQAIAGENRILSMLGRHLRCTGCGQKGRAVAGAATIGKLRYLASQLGYPDPFDRVRPVRR